MVLKDKTKFKYSFVDINVLYIIEQHHVEIFCFFSYRRLNITMTYGGVIFQQQYW